MINRLLTAALCILVGAGLAAGEPDLGRGLGGTGLTEGDRGSGIGGTGHQPSGDGRGIGGTGIVGTVRAFGSIWVNGVEVHYWEDQPLTIYDRPGTPKDLRVGQVVAMEARVQAGRLVADAIEVRHAVVGPIALLDRRAGILHALGQRIRMPQDDPLNATLREGDWIAVSGIRDPAGVVVASHLDRPPEGLEAWVRGEVEGVDSSGLAIGGRRYPLPPGAVPSAIPVGADLTLYGQPDGDTLQGSRMRIGWDLPFGGRVRSFLLEGYIDSSGQRIGGLTLPATAYRPKSGERVVVQGRFGPDGSLVPGSLRVLSAPGGPERLRLRLEDLGLDAGDRRGRGAGEGVRSQERWRSDGPDRRHPGGLSPRPGSPDDSGAYVFDGPRSRRDVGPASSLEGGVGADPWGVYQPGLPSGFPMPGMLGAPGLSNPPGAAGAASGSVAPTGPAAGGGSAGSPGPGARGR